MASGGSPGVMSVGCPRPSMPSFFFFLVCACGGRVAWPPAAQRAEEVPRCLEKVARSGGGREDRWGKGGGRGRLAALKNGASGARALGMPAALKGGGAGGADLGGSAEGGRPCAGEGCERVGGKGDGSRGCREGGDRRARARSRPQQTGTDGAPGALATACGTGAGRSGRAGCRRARTTARGTAAGRAGRRWRRATRRAGGWTARRWRERRRRLLQDLLKLRRGMRRRGWGRGALGRSRCLAWAEASPRRRPRRGGARPPRRGAGAGAAGGGGGGWGGRRRRRRGRRGPGGGRRR